MWPARRDPNSVYRSGFEVRTYRLCRRVLMFHRFSELGGAALVNELVLDHTEEAAGTTLDTIRLFPDPQSVRLLLERCGRCARL